MEQVVKQRLEQTTKILSDMKALETIYLACNPIARDPHYRTQVLTYCPTIQQLDADPL